MATASLDVISGLAGGSGFKSPCAAATTGNVSLSGLAAIDGYTPSAGDRILVWQQTNPVENGIYNAASGAWTRAIDCDGRADLFKGTQVAVANGNNYERVTFMVVTDDPITVGVTSLEFQISDVSGINFEPIPEYFGAKADGTTDDKAALDAWFSHVINITKRGRLSPKTYRYVGQIEWDLASVSTSGIRIEGATTQSSIIEVETSSSPAVRIFCSGGAPSPGIPAIQANSKFLFFGFATNLNGIGLEIGTTDFSDQFNHTEFNLTVTNSSTGSSAIGYQLNALYECDVKINTVVNGLSITAGSIGIKMRKVAFSRLKIGAASVDIGLKITDDFTYGNHFETPDLEVVNTGVLIDVPTAQTNTFTGGTYGFSDFGVKATAGSNNWFFNPNVNSAAPMFKSGADGVGVMVIGGGGNSQTQLAAPTTGQTVTINELTPALYIAAAGTLASLTINLPDNPADGQEVSITTLYELSSLSIVATPHSAVLFGTTMPAGGSITYKFYAYVATWFPITSSPLGNLSPPVTKTADFSVAPNEVSLIVDKASTCTVTLPDASAYPGREIRIKTVQSFSVVSASANVVPLHGGSAGTAILPDIVGACGTLISNGTNWVLINGTPRFFPAGSLNDLAVNFRAAGTGIYSPNSKTLAITPDASMDLTNAEMHGPIKVNKRGSISLGTNHSGDDNRFPNQSPLEIFIFNAAAGAAVPMTIWQSGPDSASVEPVIMGRDRNPDRYGNTLSPALPGDSVWVIQGQAGDSLGTANIAIANAGMRVQSGTTPIEGNTRGFAGNIFFAVSAGDGVTAILTSVEIQSDHDVNLVRGDLLINNSPAITTERYGRFTALNSHVRPVIADDAIGIVAIPGGATAMLRGVMTGVSSTAPPFMVAVRVDSSNAIINMSAYTTNLVFTTGIITDYTTCADGSLTISAGTDGNVYLCNRLGVSRTVGVHIDLNQALL